MDASLSILYTDSYKLTSSNSESFKEDIDILSAFELVSLYTPVIYLFKLLLFSFYFYYSVFELYYLNCSTINEN